MIGFMAQRLIPERLERRYKPTRIVRISGSEIWLAIVADRGSVRQVSQVFFLLESYAAFEHDIAIRREFAGTDMRLAFARKRLQFLMRQRFHRKFVVNQVHQP